MHTSEPLVPEPSAFEVEMAVKKLKRHKSPGADKIPAELIKTGGRTIFSEIHKLTNSIWNKEELPEKWKVSILYLVIRRDIKKTVLIIEAYHFLPTTYKILTNILLSRLTLQKKLFGIVSVDFDATSQLLIIYSTFSKYLRKMGIQRSSASALYSLQESL